jgi:hypothetical protein
VFGGPACSWISAWNELGVTLSTTDPTDVAASLVFVVQSPAAGLIVPNATVSPVAGTDVEVEVEVDVEVEVEVEGVVALWLLEQAETKVKVATSTTEVTAMDRPGNEVRIRAILCGSLGAN